MYLVWRKKRVHDWRYHGPLGCCHSPGPGTVCLTPVVKHSIRRDCGPRQVTLWRPAPHGIRSCCIGDSEDPCPRVAWWDGVQLRIEVLRKDLDHPWRDALLERIDWLQEEMAKVVPQPTSFERDVARFFQEIKRYSPSASRKDAFASARARAQWAAAEAAHAAEQEAWARQHNSEHNQRARGNARSQGETEQHRVRDASSRLLDPHEVAAAYFLKEYGLDLAQTIADVQADAKAPWAAVRRAENGDLPSSLRVLGLMWPFDAEDLKRAYRQKIVLVHPDTSWERTGAVAAAINVSRGAALAMLTFASGGVHVRP